MAVPLTGTPLDFITAGTALLGAVGGLKGAPAQPGIASSGGAPMSNKTDVDFSGFTVATSGSKADGANISKSTADALASPGVTPSTLGAALGVSAGNGTLWIAGAVVGVALLWRIFKK